MAMGEEQHAAPSAEQQFRQALARAESATAAATEQMVQRQAFGELLARMTENVVALTRIGFDTMDLFVRNTRVAGRTDVDRLARQLARTEDKLEMVLQEVERLSDIVEEQRDRQEAGQAGGAGGSEATAADGAGGRSQRTQR
jgi:hypothetical protein